MISPDKPSTWHARRRVALVLTGVALIATAVFFLRLRARVDEALTSAPTGDSGLTLVPVLAVPRGMALATSGDVEGLAAADDGLVMAGGFGVASGPDRADLSADLPARRASAVTAWRGAIVVGFDTGGLYVRRAGSWQEIRAGFGALHVRALAETPGGELLVGAREGLFRAAFGSASIRRLASHPVRALALGHGGLLYSGGETGLWRTRGIETAAVATADPWIESIAIADDALFVATAAGLESGPLGGALQVVPGGQDVAQVVAVAGAVFGIRGEGDDALVRFERGSIREEYVPAKTRRLFVVDGTLLADTALGLMRRGTDGFSLVSPRLRSTIEGRFHVGALAWHRGRLVAGLFDGGLVVMEEKEGSLVPRPLPDTDAWGVNALLPFGGELLVASLRGVARFDGARLHPIQGPGAAFSLTSTPQGPAIGYGVGVRIGAQGRLVSAFHGLPANQALALAAADLLYVGTPSGLGAMEGSRVLWRVAAGDGALPNPWVTALAACHDGLYVATYGGGVARRTAGRSGAPHFEAFPETAGLKINTGTLVEAEGRLFLGTEDRGLLELSGNRERFEPVRVALPSPRVTALIAGPQALYVGTDAGIVKVALATDASTRP